MDCWISQTTNPSVRETKKGRAMRKCFRRAVLRHLLKRLWSSINFTRSNGNKKIKEKETKTTGKRGTTNGKSKRGDHFSDFEGDDDLDLENEDESVRENDITANTSQPHTEEVIKKKIRNKEKNFFKVVKRDTKKKVKIEHEPVRN
jgi:hypothetical protein